MTARGNDIRPSRRRNRGSSYDEAPRVSSRGRVRPAKGPGPEGGPRVLFILFCIAFALVGARLFQLQVIDAGWLSEDAASRRTNSITILAKRGTIYDRNGNVLAMSVDCKTIYCNPSEIEDPDAIADLIAQDLGGEADSYVDSLKGDGTFSYVYRQADEDKAEQLKADLEEGGYEGVYFLDDTKRVYPYGSVANQVLGRVDVDGNGISGIEYQYDDILSGTNGVMELEMGADGTPIAGSNGKVTDAQDGTDIILSIDVNIQQTAEEAITEGVETYSADSGSVVVMDPSTGEILAICSTPLADFSDSSSVTDESLQLKPVSYSFEPGSIFKIITLSAGIESGAFTPDTTYTVPAQVQVGDDMVSDDDDRDYTETMTVREIMRRSSNTGAVLMAQTVGADTFYDTLEAFGIGQKTGIDFPGETEGIMASREEFTSTTLGVMAFGQGVAIPMIQMVRAVGGIANGGVAMTPHLLVAQGGEEVDWGDGTRVVSEDTASTVTDVLRTVTTEGTGTNAQVEGYDVVGKTGTAEMADESGGGYVSDKTVSSMIGYANGDDPSVLVYVGLNGTPHFAGESAANVFQTIMSEALGDLGVEPSQG